MTDYSELKKLAEAATPGPWAGEHDVYSDAGQGERICKMATAEDSAFISAGNPAAILALIAENEKLKAVVEFHERNAKLMEGALSASKKRADSKIAQINQLENRMEALKICLGSFSYVVDYPDDECAEIFEGLRTLKAENDALRNGFIYDVKTDGYFKTDEAIAAVHRYIDEMRKDAERFRLIQQDADAGMRRIYGDDWLKVIDDGGVQ